MKKQKQIEQEIRWLRRYVKWAVNPYSISNYPTELLIDCEDMDKKLSNPVPSRSMYTHIRKVIVPSLLTIYEEQHLITPEKHQTLLSQINSPDREDWYLALVVIDQINPHKN